jgi:hypothetical protein
MTVWTVDLADIAKIARFLLLLWLLLWLLSPLLLLRSVLQLCLLRILRHYRLRCCGLFYLLRWLKCCLHWYLPALVLIVTHRKFVVSKTRMTDLSMMNPWPQISVRPSPDG